MVIRCPHCGSPVKIRGSRWECGWCGDFGSISSLHPSEKAKLVQAASPTVQVTATMRDTSEEETPRQFSRAELEEMVRRWDLDENEWACRDLLIAAFPQAVNRWTAEDLSGMDTQDLLTEVGEQDPEAAIDMMKLLLDIVGDRLQDREVAEQLLVWDMDGLLRSPAVQEQLLQRLKQDDILARQIFQSACLDTGQQMLYEACDFYGEAELKEKLLALLEANPLFEGFA